ncbi:RNA polymerase sigma-70 factor (ECF subfamily) [Arthrobacter pigmenti]|uniref:RNA polymerase sigma-70 factor (ECF subfamily) n=1 Tax=Arthrobacter pigmenti TaxID=271432 RepID=A0A846RL99_9MICC|nr:CU044_5270 family protein [Arthrobacter pigmenti]NJC21054.1 RNA polymerase sigma-70 factor (ECF subfamily) [Arthrobacter pigmenti]
MDDLQLLREMRDDIGSVAPATLARGRKKVMAKVSPNSASTTIGPHTKGTVSPIRFRRRALIVSAAAALLVGGIVGAEVIRPTPGATAEAAEVLSNAAAATIQTSDPVVKPGQYLKIETTAVVHSGMQAADGSGVSWLAKTGRQLYIPADRNAVWVWNREESVPFAFPNEEAKAAAAELEKLPEKPLPEGATPLVGVRRAPGGAFGGFGPEVIPGTHLEEASSLPRDPQVLLDIIYERTEGKNKSPERAAFVAIADGLRTGVVPADLRATLYRAAALIPGVTLADRQATIDGRTGIAIGFPSPGGVARTDMVIDPASGLVIGERDVVLKDSPHWGPAGTVSTWTSVRTSVVDSAP